MTDEKTSQRAIQGAFYALALYAVLTAIALWAWFSREDSPWGLQSFIAMVSLVGTVAAAIAVFRAPSRASVASGIGVMLVSLVRVGAPDDWTAQTYLLFAVTSVFLIPLAHAVIVLPPKGR